MATNYVGQTATLTIPAKVSEDGSVDQAAPTCTLTGPGDSEPVDLSAFVKFLDLMPDDKASPNGKGVGAEDRWTVLTPPFMAEGDYVIDFGGQTFKITIRKNYKPGRPNAVLFAREES